MEEESVKFVCDWNMKDIDDFKTELQSVIDRFFINSSVGDGKGSYDGEKTTLYDLIGYIVIGNELVPFSFDSHIFDKADYFSELMLKRYFDYVYDCLMHFRKHDLESAKRLDFSYIGVLTSHKWEEMHPRFELLGVYDVSIRFENPRTSIHKK